MKSIAAAVCGLLAATLPAFAQIEPLHLKDSTMVLDTLEHRQGNAQQGDILTVSGREFPRSTKLPIEEIHILDLSTPPVSVGEKEHSAPTLGRRWETRFRALPRTSNGAVTMAFGNYTTPSLRGWWGGASSKSEIFVRASYTSSKGSEQYRDFRNGSANVSAGWILPETAGWLASGSVQTRLGFQGNRYRLFGSDMPSQVRSVHRLEGEVSVRSDGANESFRNALLHVGAIRMDDRHRAQSVCAGIRFDVAGILGSTFTLAMVEVWKDYQTLPSVRKENPLLGQLELGVRLQPADRLRLTVGGRVHHRRYAGSHNAWRVVPRADIVYHLGQVASLFAAYDPKAERTTLSAFVETNPYVSDSSTVRHMDVATDLRLGATVHLAGVLTGRLALSYRRVHAYPQFIINSVKLWDVSYSGMSRIFAVEAEAYVEKESTIAGMSIALKRTLAEPVSDAEIPYVPNVLLRATFRHAFNFGLTVSTDARYTGRRFADVKNVQRLSPFLRWDVRTEFGKMFRVGAEVTNVLDTRAGDWEGYAGEPRRVALSLGFTW